MNSQAIAHVLRIAGLLGRGDGHFDPNHPIGTSPRKGMNSPARSAPPGDASPDSRRRPGIPSESQRTASNRKWDKRRVIEGIQIRQQEGQPMHYKAVQQDNAPLVCAAGRYFGNWNDALTAAGLGPQRRRHAE
jgi:hypothetical protein